MSLAAKEKAASDSNRATQASGIVLGLGLPVAMFFASRSAPAILVLAAILATAGVIQAGHSRVLAQKIKAGFHESSSLAAAAFIGFAALSVLWAHFPASSAFAFGEFLTSLVAAAILGLAYSIRLPDNIGRLIAAGLAIASVATVADLQTNMWFRGALGIRPQNYVLNRTVVTLLLLVWPMLLLNGRKDAIWTATAAALAGFAILSGESGSAVLGLVAGAACCLFAVIAPRLAALAIGCGSVVMLALSPWLGRIMAFVFPPKLHGVLANTHSNDRVNIWQSFGAVVEQRPLVGSGFGSSARMAEDPVVQHVPEPLRALLGAGHPHDALLQIWVEMGAVGAVLAAIVFIFVMQRMLKFRGLAAVSAAGFAGAVMSIAAVSHGAWQGWWIADVGCAAALISAALKERTNG